MNTVCSPTSGRLGHAAASSRPASVSQPDPHKHSAGTSLRPGSRQIFQENNSTAAAVAARSHAPATASPNASAANAAPSAKVSGR
jgi:hypothetical protein